MPIVLAPDPVLEAMDRLAVPLAAPTLLGSTATSLVITWDGPSAFESGASTLSFQLQVAQRTTETFFPWQSLSLFSHPSPTSGWTAKRVDSYGSITGLEPSTRYVVRVRSVTADTHMGPYSGSSEILETLPAMVVTTAEEEEKLRMDGTVTSLTS